MRMVKGLAAAVAAFIGATIAMVVLLLMAAGVFGGKAADNGNLPGFIIACIVAVVVGGWVWHRSGHAG
jgi:hypothetical protein